MALPLAPGPEIRCICVASGPSGRGFQGRPRGRSSFPGCSAVPLASDLTPWPAVRERLTL